MTIAAAVSPSEITAQITNRFENKYLEARLIDATGTTYTPGVTVDVDFLAFEVVAGTGGYQRQVIKYETADILAYSDDGVPLDRKATIFAHDGLATSTDFSHAVLCWSVGNVLTLDAPTTEPTAGVDGTYTNIPAATDNNGVGLTIDLTIYSNSVTSLGAVTSAPSAGVDGTYTLFATTGGTGTGLTVDVTISNSGAATTDYAVSIVDGGSGYTIADSITVSEADLVAAGAVAVSAGDLVFPVGTVSGTLFSVAPAISGYNYAASDVYTIPEATLVSLGAVSPGDGGIGGTVNSVSTNNEGGNIVAVAETASPVVLDGGNEAVFYWDLKLFGFYN